MATKPKKKTLPAPVSGERTLSVYTQSLPVTLQPDEYDARCQRLAQLEGELQAHADRAKQVKDELKAEEARLLAERARLANVVRNRAEDRQVEVQDEANFTKGVVVTVRMDTYARIRERELLPEERQPELQLDQDQPEQG